MAVTYDIKVMHDDQASHQHTGTQLDAVRIQATVGYRVEVTDPLDSNFDPRKITATDVLEQPGLPQVARTIWNFNGRTVPYLTCMNTQAQRDPNKRGVFQVTTQWSTGDRNNAPASQPPPVSLADYDPRYDFSLTGLDVQRWEDDDLKIYESPSRSQYSEPLLEQVAQRVFKVTQYESFISYDEMQDRLFKINSSDWTGPQGTSIDTHKAMITDITASTVSVPVGAGVTTAAQVIMTITENTEEWLARRARIDTHYLDGGNRKAFKDAEGETFDNGKIEADGTEDTSGAAPGIETFRPQLARDFNAFIQAEV